MKIPIRKCLKIKAESEDEIMTANTKGNSSNDLVYLVEDFGIWEKEILKELMEEDEEFRTYMEENQAGKGRKKKKAK